VKLLSTTLALLALVAAGCGDDDDDGQEADAPTKAEFIEQGDKICADADQALADVAIEHYPEGPPTGDDAVAFAEDVFIPNLQGQHDDLAALTPPEGEEEAVADLLATLQAGIDEIAADPESFVRSDALEDASAAAADLGFRSCGQQ
jgi:hypothetical protein